jgi:hypothetical protein
MESQAAAVTVDDLHPSHVERTLRDLQRMVKEHEHALDKVCFRTFHPILEALLNASQLRINAHPTFAGASQSAKEKASVDAVAFAYRAVAEAAPLLPSHGSVLPALLALRRVHVTTVESNVFAKSQTAALDKLRRQVDQEKAELDDQQALQSALESRLEALRHRQDSTNSKSAEDIAQERLQELRKQKRDYDKETSHLLESFNKFINDHLSAMLAAEELGGPVVGDLMEIDTDELGAGFSTQGKLKRVKANTDEDVRQRRIDDIWGAADGQQAKKGKKRGRDEGDAAGAELKELTEQLLNRLMESAGDSAASYVTIPRETAASRFLVRSKVAQFHPKDALRLRLMDFGREIDD